MSSTLEQHLINSLSAEAAVRKPSEDYLEALHGQPGQATALLVYVEQSIDAPIELRVLATITFKNYVKRNWPTVEGQSSLIETHDRGIIKSRLIALMLVSTEKVQRQLCEAIAIIGRHDFPCQWEDLLEQLIGHFDDTDLARVNSVLHVLNSLIRHYRNEMRSDALWREVKYVIGQVAEPLTKLFARIGLLANKSVDGAKTELEPIWLSLQLIVQIFYSLNVQDLPEFFEDNMSTWMSGLLAALKLQPRALSNDDDDVLGPVEILRSHICECISMYAQRYDEEFSAFLPPFVECIWALLVSTAGRAKFDGMIAAGIQFLACVANRPQYKHMFEGEATLRQICERVVVPNMQLREDDVELFEDSPEEYIRRDLEGNDVDTRRRASGLFVQALCRHFEEAVFTIFRAYMQPMLETYARDKAGQYMQKEVCIYLVMSLASKTQTVKHGVTSISSLINLNDFYAEHIQPELIDANVDAVPLLKSTCLKYLLTYRNQLPSSVVASSLPSCIALLLSGSVVVRSYAAHAIERICLVRKDGQTIVTPDMMNVHANALYGNLFGLLEREGTELSEHGIKCVMRSMSTMRHHVLPFTEHIVDRLSAKLMIVAKNPSMPHFNHYLFECYCVLIRHVHAASPDRTMAATQLEGALFPPFHTILQNDVTEFHPYVFQILSMMLDLRGVSTGVPPPYAQLLPFLVMPQLWERSGNHQSLITLLASYIRVGANDVITANQLEPLLGVMQKLVSMRSTDHQAFVLLNALYSYCELPQLEDSMRGIWALLFARLQGNAKSPKFIKGFLINMCVFICRFGAPALVAQLEGIQGGMFAMVLDKVILKEVHKMDGSSANERLLVCVAFTRLLTQTTEHVTMNGQNRQLWQSLLRACMSVIGDKYGDNNSEGEEEVGFDALPDGYETVHATLAYANTDDLMYDPGVANAHAHLVEQLTDLNGRSADAALLYEGLDQDFLQSLQSSQLTI